MIKIVAVCACTMGFAHTFIAAEAIEQACNELGYLVKVETHGADGIQNELSRNDIDSSDVIIHATSVTIENMNKYNGCEVYEVELHDIVKDAKKVIEEIVLDAMCM